MGLQTERKVASVEVVDTILALELGDFRRGAALGIELGPQDIFMGLDATKPKRSGLELIVQAANLGHEEQELLYREFLRISLPFVVLGPKQFARFMGHLGWTDELMVLELYRYVNSAW